MEIRDSGASFQTEVIIRFPHKVFLEVSAYVYKAGEFLQELLKSWKEFEATPDARNAENQHNVLALEFQIPAEFVTSTSQQRRMTTWDWDKRIAPWMYGSLHDPEIVFHRLKLEDKEVLQLVQLMVTESIEKVNAQHVKGVKLIVVELIKVSDAQREQRLLMQWFAVSAATASLCIYLEYNKMKSRIIDLSTNLAAHSGEILSEVIQAGKHEGPWFLGKGKPLEFNWEWLQPKKPKEGGEPNDGPEKK